VRQTTFLGVSLTPFAAHFCQNCHMTLMTFERKEAPPVLTYDLWRIQFRKDCEIEDKLFAFDSLGEFTLKLLWENGYAPTVRAIAGDRDDSSLR